MMGWVWIVAWYSAASAVAAWLYALDKRRARRGGWRIAEWRLHCVELLGGWPGGAIARSMLRHKTRKGWFVAMSWGIAGLHLMVWVLWWASR
jgi:uncharacterized membrane protein YsdA (DUF1294 family)